MLKNKEIFKECISILPSSFDYLCELGKLNCKTLNLDGDEEKLALKRESELVALIETLKEVECKNKRRYKVHLDSGLIRYLDSSSNYINEYNEIKNNLKKKQVLKTLYD